MPPLVSGVGLGAESPAARGKWGYGEKAPSRWKNFVFFFGKNNAFWFVRMIQASCICLPRQHRTPFFAVRFASL